MEMPDLGFSQSASSSLNSYEWTKGNQFHAGSTPGLVYGAHRTVNERQVLVDLCQVVDEAIERYRTDGKPLPMATSSKMNRDK